MEQQMMELVDSVKECLTLVVKESSEISQEFQAGNTGRANQKLIVYLGNVNCLVDALRALHEKKASIVANINPDALQTALLAMEQAMRSRDYVLLADILEYEIKEVLVDMQGML